MTLFFLLVFFLFPFAARVTREHRESLAKLAKQSTNKSKEALRKVRSKSINQVKKFKSKVSEDTIWLLEKQVIFFSFCHIMIFHSSVVHLSQPLLTNL